MIEKKTVCQIVDEWLAGKDYFLVEVTISPDDKILVEIDHKEGVWIEDCVELSRYIESKLNREDEDYGVPVKGGAADGLDALLATVQMPTGIPVATVALNGAKNAAVLAAQILALGEPQLAAALKAEREAMAETIAKKDEALQNEIASL